MREECEVGLERGRMSERRFFNAVLEAPECPQWFIGLVKADFELDIRGVDAIAYITYPGEDRSSRVPVQIKSSWVGRDVYLERHAQYGGENVIMIVVTDGKSLGDLRRIFFAELRKIRTQNVRYDDYFTNLFHGRISVRAEELRRKMVRAQMHKATRPVRLQRPAPALPPPRISWWQRIWQRLIG